MKAVIVVPSIREDCISRFLSAWQGHFQEHVVIVVEDNPSRSFSLSSWPNVRHVSWSEIDEELGSDADLIPRRTDCVRSYGFLRALEEKPDVIVTLDDDCYPDDQDFLATHWNRLARSSSQAWVTTIDGAKPRGLPYLARQRSMPTVINHGLWSNVPDLDAPTQLVVWERPQYERPSIAPVNQIIPRGQYFPMCGMNLAFRPIMTPALYFLKMGRDYPYDRFGDIWAGVFAKRICDHLGFAVSSGSPVVRHDRASNVWANLRKESPGLEVNEMLWQRVDEVTLTASTVSESYEELAHNISIDGPYWTDLKSSMVRWSRVCSRLMSGTDERVLLDLA